MAKSPVFCLSLASALVLHTSPVCASWGELSEALKELYEFAAGAGLHQQLQALAERLKEYDTVEEFLQNDENRKAATRFFAECLAVAVARETNVETRAFLQKLLDFTKDGSFDALLKDPSQWTAFGEYLKTQGKTDPPPAFVSGTVYTGEFTSALLIAGFAMSLVLTH